MRCAWRLAPLLLAACSDPAPVARTAVERGALLFADPGLSRNAYNDFACATCHATAQHPAGDRMLPGAALDGVTARPTFWGGQEVDLLRSVNNCLRIFQLDSSGLARDDERARDLYAFLASLPPTQPAAAPFTVVASIANIPAGDATRGAAVYQRACVDCHGELHTGQGRLGGASVLPDETIAEHGGYGPLELRLTAIEKVRHGAFLGYAGQMPPFSREALDDAALADVLAYLGFVGP